jgi:outer membrane protein assembly factor BamB
VKFKNPTRPISRAARTLVLAGLATSLLPAFAAAQAVTDHGVTDLGVPDWYAQTSWPTDHHDPRNSDFSPFVVPTRHEVIWSSLDRQGLIPGAATVFAATQGVNDTLYISSARGRFFRHLDGLNPGDGSLDFTVAPWMGGDDMSTPDMASIAGTPTHDPDGNFYMPDSDQFWSWDKDGNVRWIHNFANDGLEKNDIFLNPIITREGFVGGVTLQGHVAFYDPDDGSLAAPLLSLPGEVGPPCPPAWLLFWLGGEVTIEIRELVYCVFFGQDVEIANTAAYHPETGRLFIGGAGATTEEGLMYGIDLIDDGGGNYHWEIAWQALIGAGSGASPTISPDGTQVYITDGNNILYAFDAETGDVVWQTSEGGESAASPSVAGDGILYASGGAVLLSIDPTDGSQRFAVNYNDVADQFLDPKPPIPFLIPNGNPISAIASIIAPSPGKVHVPMVLGYGFAATEPLLGRALPMPHVNVIIAVDPDDGQLIPDSVTVVPDSIEGALTPLTDGRMGVGQGVIFSALSYYVGNPILLFLGPLGWQYFVPGPPTAGYVGMEPESYHEFLIEQIDAVIGYTETAEAELPGGALQATYDQLRLGRLQLQISDGTISDAIAKGEIKDEKKTDKARDSVASAQSALDEATELLLGDPSEADQGEARALALAARGELDSALKNLGKPKK